MPDLEREPGAGGVLLEDDRDAARAFQRAAAERIRLQFGGQRKHFGLLVGRQVVVTQEVPCHCGSSRVLSRMFGNAVRNSSICASVMTSGGASRITSAAAALTRNPASRAATSTGLAASERQHDAAQQSAAADVVDQRVTQRLDAVMQRLAEHVGAPDQIVVGQHPQHGERRGRADRVAAERAAVQAGGEQFADAADRQAGADRQTAAEALGQGHDVGGDAVVLVGEKRAGAAHPGLHFVEDQQRAVRGGDLARGDQVARRAARRRRPPP